MSEKNYCRPVLIYGATLAACGMAQKLGPEALVIERSSLLGHEFIDSYNPGSGPKAEILSSESESLKSELMERSILSEDCRIHLPAAAPVLFDRIKNSSLNFLFMTEVVSIDKIPNGYEVKIYNNSGYQTLQTGRIIDTSSFCSSCPPIAKGKLHSKSLNALLHKVDTTAGFPSPRSADVLLIPGRFESEAYLSLKVGLDEQWTSAREKLHTFWLNRDDGFTGWKLAAAASTFAVKSQSGPFDIDNNWTWLPSCAYDNLLQAFEAGLAYGKSLTREASPAFESLTGG